MTAEGKRDRIQTADLLKGLAVIFMVQVHIMELFVVEDTQAGPAGMLSLFLGGVPAAPVFMIVMGYLAGFRRKRPAVLFLRGLKLLFAGMLLNTGLNAHLIYRVLFDGWGATVNIWHFIFGADILHLAGLSLMTMSLFLRIFKDLLLPWALLLLAVSLATSFISPYPGDESIPAYALAFIHSSAGWSYFPLLPWLAYPLAGFLFFLLEMKYLKPLLSWPFMITVAAVISVFLAFTVRYAASVMHDLPAYYHHGAGFIFWALAFVAWWSVAVSLAERYAGRTRALRYVKWLGMNVTAAYVFQWLLIGNIATAVYKSLSLDTSVAWFTVILIFTSLLTFIWNKLKEKYPNTFPVL